MKPVAPVGATHDTRILPPKAPSLAATDVGAVVFRQPVSIGLKAVAPAPLVALTFLSFHYFALISWAQRAIADPVALVDQLMTVHLKGLKKGTK